MSTPSDNHKPQSQQHVWKWIALSIAAVVIIVCIVFALVSNNRRVSSAQDTPQSSSGAAARHDVSRTILIYYSLTNNTDRLAKRIHADSGITTARIQAQESYPSSDNDAINARVASERNAHRYDALTGVPQNLSSYDTVLLGYPIWSNDVAYPIQSFLAQNARTLEGKNIVPFSTSAMAADDAIQQSNATIRALAPHATIREGLNLTSGDDDNSAVMNWLNGNVFTQPSNSTSANGQHERTAITLSAHGQSFTGYLNDSPAGKELSGRLPQTLTFATFAEGYPEKFAKLPQSLNSNGMPGHEPGSGDIDYNSNNNSLFIYSGSVGNFKELHNIGHIDTNGFAEFLEQQHDDFQVVIEQVQ